jgi:hypothetical protein
METSLQNVWPTTRGVLDLVGIAFVFIWIHVHVSYGHTPYPMALRLTLIIGVYVTILIGSIDLVRGKPVLSIVSMVPAFVMLYAACAS